MSQPVPKPELNGEIFKLRPDAVEIYLILDGLRCHIPNPTTYNLLFRNGASPGINPDLLEIEEGLVLSNEACLMKTPTDHPIYLVNNGRKRHIVSEEVMDKYKFNWKTIKQVPAAIVAAIPDGNPVR